jgi:hypothetical protein
MKEQSPAEKLRLEVAMLSVPAGTGATVVLGSGALECTLLNAFASMSPPAELAALLVRVGKPVTGSTLYLCL